MKKLIIILASILFGINVFGQSPEYDGVYLRDFVAVGDSVAYKIYKDTLVNPSFVRDYVANNSPSASLDSFYVAGQDVWVTNGDTIYKVDSSIYAENGGGASDSSFVSAEIDTLKNVIVVDFDTTKGSPSYQQGRVFWDTTNYALAYYTGIGNTANQIGQESWTLVQNNTGSLINNGDAVYIYDAGGEIARIDLADADNGVTAYKFIGIATSGIPHGSMGFVTIFGDVHDVNTLGMVEGNEVYLSTTAGEWTQTKPNAHIIRIGFVKYAHATEGIITVNPSYDTKLDFAVLKNDGSDGTYIDSTSITVDSVITPLIYNPSSININTNGTTAISTQRFTISPPIAGDFEFNDSVFASANYNTASTQHSWIENIGYGTPKFFHIINGDTVFKSTSAGLSINGGDVWTTSDTTTIYEGSRLFIAFSDSAYTETIAAANTPVHVGGDSLWSVYRNTGQYPFTVQNDSFQVTIPGTNWYEIEGDASFYGNNGDRYVWHIYVDGVEVANRGKFVRGMTTTTRGVVAFSAELQIAQNSWISFWVENVNNTNDPTFVTSNIRIHSTDLIYSQ